MGRKIADQNYEDFILRWRADLLGIGFADLTLGERRLRFDFVAGQPADACEPGQRRRLDTALKCLVQAIAADQASGSTGHTALDGWIVSNLLTDDANMLIWSKKARAALLARVRNRHRRKAQAEAGWMGVRVEMTKADWVKLRTLDREFGTTTAGETMSALIAQWTARPKARRKLQADGKSAQVTKAAASPRDLFTSE